MSLLQDLLTEVPLSAVLRERVTLAEERFQRANEEVQVCRQRIAALEEEIKSLRTKLPVEPVAKDIGDDTIRVLLHLFRASDMDHRDVGIMAQALQFEKSVLQYHLDRLDEIGLAEVTGANYLHGHVYWALTPEGRRYVVERNLI
jgi:hypothetical protein